MGGKRKALLDLCGTPLLMHVADRLQHQSAGLLLNCDNQPAEFKAFGLPLVPDLLPGYRGPLTGLYSALQHVAENGLGERILLCPCDAPFLPLDLTERLLAADSGDQGLATAVSYQGVLQPTFSLWHLHHLPAIRKSVVEQGYGSLKHLFFSLPHEVVKWAPATPSPFFNINTPEDLKSATTYLD